MNLKERGKERVGLHSLYFCSTVSWKGWYFVDSFQPANQNGIAQQMKNSKYSIASEEWTSEIGELSWSISQSCVLYCSCSEFLWFIYREEDYDYDDDDDDVYSNLDVLFVQFSIGYKWVHI